MSTTNQGTPDPIKTEKHLETPPCVMERANFSCRSLGTNSLLVVFFDLSSPAFGDFFAEASEVLLTLVFRDAVWIKRQADLLGIKAVSFRLFRNLMNSLAYFVLDKRVLHSYQNMCTSHARTRCKAAMDDDMTQDLTDHRKVLNQNALAEKGHLLSAIDIWPIANS